MADGEPRALTWEWHGITPQTDGDSQAFVPAGEAQGLAFLSLLTSRDRAGNIQDDVNVRAPPK